MKNTIGYIVSSLMITFLIVLSVSIINVFSTINKATAYHETCIAEIQASNFASNIIDKYIGDTGDYQTTIANRTVDTDPGNIEKTGRIYEVITEYEIEIPVINYHISKTIQGYAR